MLEQLEVPERVLSKDTEINGRIVHEERRVVCHYPLVSRVPWRRSCSMLRRLQLVLSDDTLTAILLLSMLNSSFCRDNRTHFKEACSNPDVLPPYTSNRSALMLPARYAETHPQRVQRRPSTELDYKTRDKRCRCCAGGRDVGMDKGRTPLMWRELWIVLSCLGQTVSAVPLAQLSLVWNFLYCGTRFMNTELPGRVCRTGQLTIFCLSFPP